MNSALEKIQRLQADLSHLQNQHEALVLENQSLRLAVQDMQVLRTENLLLKGRLDGYQAGMNRALGGSL
jgi:FtsZ-binding cell division protein ZapB